MYRLCVVVLRCQPADGMKMMMLTTMMLMVDSESCTLAEWLKVFRATISCGGRAYFAEFWTPLVFKMP